MAKPLISIVVPTFNVEKYLGTCIKSLINQTLSNIEIILVDDGSTDRSGIICDEYAKKDLRIKVIHQTNRGLGLSRNSGLFVATGEYVGFVDSDDFVSKDMYRVLYEIAHKHGAEISCCTFKKFSDENEITDPSSIKLDIKVWSGESEIRKYMLDRIGLPPEKRKDNLYGASVCCGIFSRQCLLDLNAKFASERQFIAEDMIFDIDVIPHCQKIVHCNMPLYYYRNNPNSLTTVYKQNRFEKNVQLYHEMYRRLPCNYKNDCFNSMSRYLLTAARVAVIQEVRFAAKNGNKSAKEKIAEICNAEEITDVLTKYEYWKLPIKYCVTCFLMKNKCINPLFWLYRIKFR